MISCDPGSNPGRAIRNIFILSLILIIMVIGVTIFVIAVLIIAIWVIIEVKRLRHKLFAMFLIALILFAYISFTFTLKGQDIDFKTIPGLMKATKIYFSWLGSVFGNLKSITTYAVKMNWNANETVEEGEIFKLPS